MAIVYGQGKASHLKWAHYVISNDDEFLKASSDVGCIHIFKWLIMHHIVVWASLLIKHYGWKCCSVVLGSDDRIPKDGHIEVYVKSNNIIDRVMSFLYKLCVGIDLLLGKNWLVQNHHAS